MENYRRVNLNLRTLKKAEMLHLIEWAIGSKVVIEALKRPAVLSDVGCREILEKLRA